MQAFEQINLFLKQNLVKASLPQAVRMSIYYLKLVYPGDDTDRLYARLRFKANPSLGFQKSELSKVEIIEQNDEVFIELTLNFLSIFGSSSPLPSHFSEAVLNDLDASQTLKDFLNIFNHHLQKLVFPIWLKHRYYMQYQNDLKDDFSKYMLSLIGLIDEHKNKKSHLNLHKLLPYLGTLSMRVKSAGMIVSILRHYLCHHDITIRQCQIDTIAIPSWQYMRLGKENTSLGSDTSIGEFVKCSNGKFTICLHGASWSDLFDYGLYGAKLFELKELIEFMLKEPLNYDLKLEVMQQEVVPCRLSSTDSAYLGINSVIGNRTQNLNVTFIC
jgi:type VI secretion system protein ImpH